MTPEALTQARVQEAIRLAGIPKDGAQVTDYGAEVALAMARLIAEDWKPARPRVNPLLVEAREIAGAAYVKAGYHQAIEAQFLDGHMDTSAAVVAVRCALRARQPTLKPWTGGQNPARGKLVWVKYRNGTFSAGPANGFVGWPHFRHQNEQTPYEIVAYAVLEEGQ